MTPLAALLLCVGAIHAAALLADRLFRGRRSYSSFLHSSGLDPPRPMQLRWSTHRLNRTFTRLGAWRPRLVRAWFSVGAVATLLLVFPSMVLLVRTLLNAILPAPASAEGDSERSTDRIVLQPVLPGVNLPLGDLGYYFVTLLVCSVVHEAGHAAAAAAEDVRVLGFGAFVLFLLPAAFVDLPTDQLMALSPWQQLRVFAAGVWHNIVLAALAYLVLFSTPALASHLYRTGEGVSVVSVRADSSVGGPAGLAVGDEISAINGCQVKGLENWQACLTKVLEEEVSSVCVEGGVVGENAKDFVRAEEDGDTDKAECCDSEESKSSICFERLEHVIAADSTKPAADSLRACLPVRATLEAGDQVCDKSSKCIKDGDLCMRPMLSGEHSRLLRARRKGKKDFLFVGSPAEVFQGARVSPHLQLHPLLPPWLPGAIELLSHYLASFSGALAVLNAVPCLLLDGHHLSRAATDLFLGGASRSVRTTAALSFVAVGTALLAANIVVGLWQLV